MAPPPPPASESSGRTPKNKDNGASVFGRLAGAALLLYAVGFLWFRLGELCPLVARYARECMFTVALVLGPLRRRLLPSWWARGALCATSLAALAYLLDHYVPRPLPPPSARPLTVVVTGANSGVGYETARRLAVDYDVRVVMGCRSEARCRAAAGTIAAEVATEGSRGSVVPLLVDLSSLDSAAAFADSLVDDYQVDVLFNNAGFLPVPHTPVNKHGIEYSFTAMHLAPFLLTERLLAARPRLRVVNTSSATHHACAVPWSLSPLVRAALAVSYEPGCVNEGYLRRGIRTETGGAAAYIHAKVANVLHAVELPRRHPQALSVAIDLGWVGTAIQPWMRGSVTPANLGWMRSARVGVAPVLQAILANEEELRVDLGKHRKQSKAGFVMNVFGVAEEAFSYRWWRKGAAADLSTNGMILLGEKLWEESEKLLEINGF